MLTALNATDDEARRCLRDVVALSTLPAMWFGAEPRRVAESLAAALFTTVRPELVVVVYADGSGRPLVAAAQTGRYQSSPELARELAPQVLAWARSRDPDEVAPFTGLNDSGPLRLVVRPIGHLAEFGAIAAAFASDREPTASHQLLLNIAATQAATAVQNLRLLASLRDESQVLETLNRTGAALAAEIDLERLVQTVTDAGVEITGAEFGAFFYTVADEGEESFMLYTLSGADRADFERFPHPRATAVFGSTFRGEGVVRSADITADPRYGQNAPYHGMPPGHLPVRSYLAIPVTSRSGAVIGGLFFGHADPGVFSARSERVMVGLAGQAAIAIDNAQLFRAAQRVNQTLEQRIQERTLELQTAHEALRQAQKMEAIGQLTGGIAHDFNNLLTVIRGSAEVLRRPGLTDDRRRRYVDAISDTAERAAKLTGQLLAFARRQALSPEVFDARARVGQVSDMLRSVLGGRIQLEVVGGDAPCFVEADPVQLETALVNMAVNARDAMDGEGCLTIRVGRAAAAEASPAKHDTIGHVAIQVTDTGRGIPREHIDRIFEPFFTTKEIGKGTGLGLSQVYGFAQQSGGRIDVRSEPGRGTTFTLYLPSSEGAAPTDRTRSVYLDGSGGDGRVLIVEDNDEVRTFADQLLNDLGYQTALAASADEALKRLEEEASDFDVVFSDVVMPGTGGVEFGKLVRERWPHLPVVLTSGYSHVLVQETGHGFPLLHKPYSVDALAAVLREALTSRASAE